MNGLYTPRHIILALYSGGDLNHGADTEIFKRNIILAIARRDNSTVLSIAQGVVDELLMIFLEGRDVSLATKR